MIFGWDIGGAHLKAACVEGGAVRDVAQVRESALQFMAEGFLIHNSGDQQ